MRSPRIPRPARTATVALVGLLFAGTAGLSAQTEITAGTPIRDGGRLAAPLAGIQFEVPSGFAGGWDVEASGVVLESAAGMIMGLWGWSEGEVEEVAVALDQELSGLGLELQARGEPRLTDTELTGSFDAWSQEGRGLLAAAIRRGSDGNVFAIAVLGATEAGSEVERIRDGVIASLELTTPGAAGWRTEVEGAVLEWSSSGSDMSSGTTTATGASSSEAWLALCPAGMYRYSEESESYVSIEGMSSSSSSSDGHAGQWWITADIAGQAMLTLESNDGRVFYWSVEEAGDAFLIDGYRYVLNGSC